LKLTRWRACQPWCWLRPGSRGATKDATSGRQASCKAAEATSHAHASRPCNACQGAQATHTSDDRLKPQHTLLQHLRLHLSHCKVCNICLDARQRLTQLHTL
jgi:hypothetical protein